MKKKILIILTTIFAFSTLMLATTACNGFNNADLSYVSKVMGAAIDELDYLNTLMFRYADDNASPALLSSKKMDGEVASFCKKTAKTATSMETGEDLIPADVYLNYENPKQAIARQLNAKYPFEVVNYLLKNAVDGKYYKKKYEIGETFYGEATHIINAQLNEYFKELNIKPILAINVQKEENGMSFMADWDWRDPVLAQDAPAYNTVICTNGKVEYDNNSGKVNKIYMSWYWEESQENFMACLLDLEAEEFYYLGCYRNGNYFPQEESVVDKFNSGVNFVQTFIEQNYHSASIVKANVVDDLSDFNYVGYNYSDSDVTSNTGVVDPGEVSKEDFVALMNEVYSNVCGIKLRGKEGYLSLDDATEIDYMNQAAIYGYNRTSVAVNEEGINYFYTDEKDMKKILDGLSRNEVITANSDAVGLINKAKIELEKQDGNYLGDLGQYFGSGIEYYIDYGDGYTYDGWCHYCKNYRRVIKNDNILISFDYTKNNVSNVYINEDFGGKDKGLIDCTFEYDEKLGGYCLTRCVWKIWKEGAVIELPATHQNKPVVAIGANAIAGITFESIIIPNSVISIGDSAFTYCQSLTSVVLPDGLLSIGENAFDGCVNLTNIQIPDSVTSIGNGVFNGCASLTSIDLPDGLSSIGENAFDGCINLTNIQIPDGVTNIGNGAFSACASLTSIDLPDGLSSIGENAFNGCINLTNIKIPNNVTSISNRTFYGCKSLTSIDLPDGLSSIGENAFNGCINLTNIKIPNNVTSISNRTFYGCKSLTSVDLPDGLLSISETAFSGCDNLQYKEEGELRYLGNSDNKYLYLIRAKSTSITTASINANCKVIANAAFYNCRSLTSVDLPDGLFRICEKAFYGCRALTNIQIPDGVTSIGDNAFNGCQSLTSVVLPDGLLSIGIRAFYGCKGLTSVQIPNGVTSIGDSAFGSCRALTNIQIPNSVTSIGNGVFDLCNNLQYNVEDELKYLGNSNNKYLYLAGVESTSITTASINANCKFIANSAFYNCRSLTSVDLPDGLLSIDYGTFFDCVSLTSITIPQNVKSIGEEAFYGCYRLAEVINRSAHITVEKGKATNGRVGERALAVYNCDSGITKSQLVNDNGYIIYIGENEKILVGYNGQQTDLTLPNDITKINNYAFYGCTSLTRVIMGNYITSIGNYAFSGCESLANIEISNAITSIGDGVFNGCNNLQYNVENKLKYLGNSNNKYLYLAGVESTDIMEACVNANCKIIANSAFALCGNLGSVELPEGLLSIGVDTFFNCISLTSIEIPESVTSIGAGAFYGCYNLRDVLFRDTSNWYITQIVVEWENKTGGNSVVVTDSRANASQLTRQFAYWYWFKK